MGIPLNREDCSHILYYVLGHTGLELLDLIYLNYLFSGKLVVFIYMFKGKKIIMNWHLLI